MTTSMDREPDVLPAVSLARRSYELVFANWLSAVKISWAWLVPIAVLSIGISRSFPHAPGQLPSGGTYIAAAAAMVTILFGAASIAVAWHRLMLMHEAPSVYNLGVDGLVLRYVGRLIVLSLIAGVVQMLCSLPLIPLLQMMPATSSITSIAMSSLATFLASLPALYVMSRFVVVLPSVAIGRPLRYSEARRITQGDTARLFLGTILIYAPSYLVELIVTIIQTVIGKSWTTNLIAVSALWISYFVCFLAAMSFLSLSYRFFLERLVKEP